ncbi:P-loop containing nucleoside triphosphate hydrolase protein, partial [Auriscalpium vulgare]
EELKLLPGLIKANFKSWTAGAKPFQLEGIAAQVLQRDTIIHAATGAGKTGIIAGPHLLPSSKGKVTLVVSPLIALQDEQVATFKDEFGMAAIAINSSHGGCTIDKLKKIVNGDWQIVLLSPEMLQSRRFTENVLRKKAFGSRCLSVFIDEAHCVSHWGASFRKKYGTVGVIRAFLPKSTPFIAVSATMTSRVRHDIALKLQFHRSDYDYINIGNDRPAVAQIVRAIEHPLNTFADLGFVIPAKMARISEIPKTFLYTDDIQGGSLIVDHLNAQVADEFRTLGLVRPYSAAMSKKYRRDVMKLFYAGIVRVLVCTDAAGMGCNIPDIDLVVQWKLPPSLSAWVQRAGRAARGAGRTGKAILLVEKSAFEVDPCGAIPTPEPAVSHPTTHGRKTKQRTRRKAATSTGKRGREYAALHGQLRGSMDAQHDAVEVRDEPRLVDDAPGEGLYAFIQTTVCRRDILVKVFENDRSDVPKAQCCDLCNPTLFNGLRAGQPPKLARKRNAKRGEADEHVRERLFAWRRAVKKSKYPRARWAPHAILDNDTCELLASIEITSIEKLADLLKTSWAYWDALGSDLFELL